MEQLSAGLAVLLIVAYGLGMLFSLGTHQEMFASEGHGGQGEVAWPMPVALVTLAVVTLLVALVSEIFVGSVQVAADDARDVAGLCRLRRGGAGRGGGGDDHGFAAARRDRLDLSVGIALGQRGADRAVRGAALVLLSYVIGPAPMDLLFWPGAVVMVLIATMTATLATNGGQSAWFVGVMLLMVYAFFGLTLFLLPPG